MSQFCRANIPIPVFIEHLERLLDLFLEIGVTMRLSRHNAEELRETDHATAICIDFVDHVLQRIFGWVLAERSYDIFEVFGHNPAFTIIICRTMYEFHVLVGSMGCVSAGLRVRIQTSVEQREGFHELWITT